MNNKQSANRKDLERGKEQTESLCGESIQIHIPAKASL